jgi:sugar/nucleoside kinase (ribokinase family)
MPLRLREPDTRARSDYVVVGHVTVDRFETGQQQPGGSVYYSAALAARCGLSVTLVTAGSPAVIATALADLLDAIDVVVTPADTSTTFLTWYDDDGHRHQRVLAAAPEIAQLPVQAGVLHLAPILHETPAVWLDGPDARLTAVTPQGLVRHTDADGDIRLAASPGLDQYAADVAVLSEHELGPCAQLADRVAGRGGTVVVTRAGGPAEVRVGRDAPFRVPAIPTPVEEELGAGDVFAAALFVALHDGRPITEAVQFAHAAASLRLAGRGIAAIPTRAEIERHAARELSRDES